MKSILRIILLIACCAVPAALGLAQSSRGPSTPDERLNAVKAARLLESEPFHKNAAKTREWFIRWLIEVPDISVEACSGFLGPLVGKKGNLSEVFLQPMFSSAAFIIEHPDRAKDRTAVNLAGVEGALKVYEAMLREKPKTRLESLDGLIVKRDKGELRAYVEEVGRTTCKEK